MKDHSKILLIISFFFALTLLTLGGWWLYLLIKLGDRLKLLEEQLGEPLGRGPDLVNLVKWEGSTFLLILALLSITMLVLYLKDQKKTKALQDFFASLTHELKTPLASVRLQAEVMTDKINQRFKDQDLIELGRRMVEDTAKLEAEMDKILQLSRLERGGGLNLLGLDLHSYLKQTIKIYAQDLKIQYKAPEDLELQVLADEFALRLIFKNLFENTRLHVAPDSQVSLSIEAFQDLIIIHYRDEGKFQGDTKKLSHLFYKHQSSKGTGIGLYLVKKSLQAMQGRLEVETHHGFHLKLHLKRAWEESL